MLFYCVTTSFDDRGHVVSNITATKECDCMPDNSFVNTSRRDIYSDWFDSMEKAKKFVQEAREC